MSTVLFFVFLFAVLVGTPVAIALGVGAICGIAYGGFDLVVFVHRMTNGINSFTLVAVPLFILAGRLAGDTGLAKRLVNFASSLVGHIPGGLGLVNVLASMFFGGISGAAAADTAAIGGMMIPSMKEKGFDGVYAAGITAASSTIGTLIPPSIPLCIYGITAGLSIGALFIGGLLPGILVGLLQMLVAYLISVKRGYPCEKRADFKEIWKTFRESILALLLPIIMLCGVSFGVATATEVGVIAVIYAFIVGVFVYKEFHFKELPKILADTGVITAVALLIVGVTTVISWIVAVENLPAKLTEWIFSTTGNSVIILLIIDIILLLIGCFMDQVPAMLLFTPIFLPIVQQAGVTPIQFGIIMAVALGIGVVTPPVGNCLFIASGIAREPILKTFCGALPFVLVNITVLLIVTYFQPISLWLPALFGMVG